MVTFAEIAGLPISFDSVAERLVYDQKEVTCDSAAKVGIREIVPALLNKALLYPESVYEEHHHMVRKEDEETWPRAYTYNIVHIPAGLLGIEYNKTHIFFASRRGAVAACLVQVLSGELTVILQQNECKQDVFAETCVKDARIIVVVSGQKMIVPVGYFYTFINACEYPVTFAVIMRGRHIVDYKELHRENGLAYYLIAKNAKQEIVANPRYRKTVEVRQVGVDELNSEFGFQPGERTSLYAEGLKYKDVFSRLLGC
jgi:oxalate decarboxylase/phosphoglucose isomerase-like protein (cupin superfamily)